MPQITIDLTDDAYALLTARADRRTITAESFAKDIVSYSLVFGWKDQLEAIQKIRQAVNMAWLSAYLLLPEQQSKHQFTEAELLEHYQLIYQNAKNADELLGQIAPGTTNQIGGPDYLTPPTFSNERFSWLLTEFPLRPFMESLLSEARANYGFTSEHPLFLTIEEDVPEQIRTEAETLHYVLDAFITWISKSLCEGNTINFTVRCDSSDRLRFTFHEETIGMPPEQLARIGEFVSHVDFPLSFGIGFAALHARLLATRHGGKVWAESEGLGKGSMVSFTLPIHAQDFIWDAPDHQKALSELRRSHVILSAWLAEAEWLPAKYLHFDDDARSALAQLARTELDQVLALLDQLEKDHATDHD
jgi:hypothetical protein